MKVTSYRCCAFYNSYTGEGFDPSEWSITKKGIRRYMKEHPFTKDPAYPLEDIISDLTESGAYYTVDIGITAKTEQYLIGMLNALCNKEENEVQ